MKRLLRSCIRMYDPWHVLDLYSSGRRSCRFYPDRLFVGFSNRSDVERDYTHKGSLYRRRGTIRRHQSIGLRRSGQTGPDEIRITQLRRSAQLCGKARWHRPACSTWRGSSMARATGLLPQEAAGRDAWYQHCRNSQRTRTLSCVGQRATAFKKGRLAPPFSGALPRRTNKRCRPGSELAFSRRFRRQWQSEHESGPFAHPAIAPYCPAVTLRDCFNKSQA